MLQVNRKESAAWRVVEGHKVSPSELIYVGGKWIPPYQASSIVDPTVGFKMLVAVEADSDEEHNYYLSSGTPLLVHNTKVYYTD